MQAFCKSLPEDRILHGDDYDLDDILRKDGGKRIYILGSTGAKLTYEHAINILTRYASSLVRITPYGFISDNGLHKEPKSNTKMTCQLGFIMSLPPSVNLMFAKSSCQKSRPFEESSEHPQPARSQQSNQQLLMPAYCSEKTTCSMTASDRSTRNVSQPCEMLNWRSRRRPRIPTV